MIRPRVGVTIAVGRKSTACSSGLILHGTSRSLHVMPLTLQNHTFPLSSFDKPEEGKSSDNLIMDFNQSFRISSKWLPLQDDGFYPRKLIIPKEAYSASPYSDGVPSPFRFFRDGKLNVTDIATKYCELQDFYYLCSGGKDETMAMTAGTSVHLDLEKEAEKLLAPKVQFPETLVLNEVEKFAQRFLNILSQVDALNSGIPVREFYVFGTLDEFLVTGYIDEILIHPEKGLIISDTKTRVKSSLPPESQRLSAYHQLLVYHRLLSSMIAGFSDYDRLYEVFKVDPDQGFQKEFAAAVTGDSEPDPMSIRTLEDALTKRLAGLSHGIPLSDELQVSYVKSAGELAGSLIGTCQYRYDEETTESLKNFALGFWRGDREAVGVDPSESFKCRYCPMSDQCEWRATMEAATS